MGGDSMIFKQINSEKDGTMPWYDVDVSDNELTILKDLDGQTEFDLTGESVDIPADGVIGVTTDGGLYAGDIDNAPQLRARLAYHNGTEWVVLDFETE